MLEFLPFLKRSLQFFITVNSKFLFQEEKINEIIAEGGGNIVKMEVRKSKRDILRKRILGPRHFKETYTDS
jgi:hypothetical protein